MNVYEQNEVMREELTKIMHMYVGTPSAHAEICLAAIGPAPEQGKDEQQKFEAWYQGEVGGDMPCIPSAWKVWQAARAHQPASPPYAASITPEQPAADSVDTPLPIPWDMPRGMSVEAFRWHKSKLSEAEGRGQASAECEVWKKRAETAEAELAKARALNAVHRDEIKHWKTLAAQVTQAGQAPVNKMRSALEEIRNNSQSWEGEVATKALSRTATPAPEPVKPGYSKEWSERMLKLEQDADANISAGGEPLKQDGQAVDERAAFESVFPDAIIWRDGDTYASGRVLDMWAVWNARTPELIHLRARVQVLEEEARQAKVSVFATSWIISELEAIMKEEPRSANLDRYRAVNIALMVLRDGREWDVAADDWNPI